MRTLNVRFASILLGSFVVFCVLVYAVHAFQIKRNAGVMRDQAREAMKEGNIELALRNYVFYLKQRDDDIDVLEEYAIALADRLLQSEDPTSRMFGDAFGTLEKVVRIEPSRSKARRKLVTLCMLPGVGRYRGATEHIEDYLLKDSPKDSELLVLLGRCAFLSGENEKAVEALRKAIEYKPDNFVAYGLLASVLRGKLERFKQADEEIAKVVEKNPDSCDAHLLLANYQLNAAASRADGAYTNEERKAMLDSALNHAKKALELEPENSACLIAAARCEVSLAVWHSAHDEDGTFDRSTAFEGALEYAKRAIELHPDVPELLTVLADIELRSGNREAAIIAIQEGRNRALAKIDLGQKVSGTQLQLVWNAAKFLIDSGDLEEARKTIAKLEQVNFKAPLVGYLNAKLLFAERRWRNAAAEFERIRPSLTNWQELLKEADFLRGQCYGELGETEKEITAYRSALAIDAFYNAPRVALSDVLQRTDQLDDAIKEYAKFLVTGKSAPPPEALIPYVQLLIKRNLALHPNRRNWKRVEDAISRAAVAMPGSLKVAGLRTDALMAQARWDEAVQVMEKARQDNPKEVSPWVTLALIAQKQDKWDEFDRIIRDAKQKFGDVVQLRIALARGLAQRYGEDGVGQIEKLANDIDRFSDDDQRTLLKRLLVVLVNIGDLKAVKEVCYKAIAVDPADVNSRLLMYELALREDDPKAIRAAIAGIREAEGEGPTWYFARATELSVAADRDKDPKLAEEAMILAKKSQELQPGLHRVDLLLGSLYFQQEKYDLALKHYRAAIDAGMYNPGALRRTIHLLYVKQEYKEADELLAKLSNVPPELLQVASQGALRLDNFDRAVELARRNASQSQKYLDHLWLGHVLSVASGQKESAGDKETARQMIAEAEQAFRMAVELEPKVPDTWVALVQFLAAAGKAPAAELLMEQAEANIPEDKANIALARCYEAIDQPEKAGMRYRDALADSPDDAAVVKELADYFLRTNKPKEAEAQLRRIVDGKVSGTKADARWARRRLAVLLISKNEHKSSLEAKAMVEKNLKEDPSTEDKTALVRVLRTLPETKKEVIEDLLKEIGSEREDPEVLLQLAMMYLGNDNWPEFTSLMQKLVGEHRNQPRYLIAYIDALLARGEASEAHRYVGRLEEIAPNDARTYTSKMQVLAAFGRTDNVISVAKEYMDNSDALPNSSIIRMAVAASSLENISLELKDKGRDAPERMAASKKIAAEAERIFKQYVRYRPEHRIVLAAFYARQGLVEPALKMIEESWQTAGAESLAQVILLILGNEDITPQQVSRGEAVAKLALEKHDRPMSLLRIMAEVRTKQKRYAEAEALYRNILDENAGHAVALNNLAVLLALKKDKLDEALSMINRAIELAGPQPAMLDSRATVYLAMGNPKKALAELDLVLGEEDNTPVHLFHQAQAYQMLGNKRLARAAFDKAEKAGLTEKSLQPFEVEPFTKLKAALNLK